MDLEGRHAEIFYIIDNIFAPAGKTPPLYRQGGDP